MAWIFFQESEGSASPLANGSSPYPTAKSSHTAKASSCKECKKAICPKHQFGTIYELYPRMNYHESTSSTGGFPVKISALPAVEKAWREQRSGLFFEIMRLAEEIKPQFLFLENVPAITTRGGLRVVSEIAKRGYDCRWCTLSASEVGALHKRERWFLLAYSIGKRLERFRERAFCSEKEKSMLTRSSDDVADSDSEISSGLRFREKEREPIIGMCGQYSTVDEWQKAVSSVCRVTDGIPNRVDRIKALGNAVVPCQVREAFMRLSVIKTSNNPTS